MRTLKIPAREAASTEGSSQPPSHKRPRQTSAKTRVIRGVVGAWLMRGCLFLIAFFMTPFMVRSLGNEQYGLWMVVSSLGGVYALMDMGLNGATQKYIAQFHAVGDMESVNRVFVTSMVFYWGLAALLMVVSLVVAFFFPFLFPTTTLSVGAVRTIVILSACTIAIKFAAQSFEAAITALHLFNVSQAGKISQTFLQVAAAIAVLTWGGGLVELSAAFLGVAIIGRVTRAIVARKILPGFSTSLRHFNLETFQLIFRFGVVMAPAAALGRFTDTLGNLLIGTMLGSGSVTYYAIAESLASKVRDIGQGVVGVIAPSASRLEAKSNMESLFTLMAVSSRVLASLSLALTGLLLIDGHAFLGLWVGDEIATRSSEVLPILCFALVARMASTPLRAILRGTGTVRVILIAAIIEFATTILAALIMIPWRGYVGMAWATLAGQVALGVAYMPFASCTALGFSYRRYLAAVWPAALVVGTIAVSVTCLFANLAPATNWAILVCHGMLVASGTVLGTFYVCLNRSQRHDIISACQLRGFGR